MASQVLYGFHDIENLFDQRVTEAGVDVVSNAVDRAIAHYNEQTNALLALFASKTTGFKTRYNVASFSRLQPLDDSGRARKIRAGAAYEVAFPIMEAGAAWGANYVARVKMTVEEANRATQTLIAADARWVRDQTLAGLFTNVAYTFDDPEHGALTVEGLANADTVEYLKLGGADLLATDNHYFGYTDITDLINPYPEIAEDLTEHAENQGQVIHLVSSSLIAKTVGLALYVGKADGNIEFASRDQLTGQPGVSYPGTLKGYVEDGGFIVEWPALPSGYIVSMASGGERPLAMREHAESELQGFKEVGQREDHPFWEAQYARRVGFGGWNRVGAAVTFVDAGGSYVIPTGYQAPIS